MSVDEEVSKKAAAEATVDAAEAGETESVEDEEQERRKKILKAKELYSQGSRNYLVKCYNEAADQLSEVCALYDELYGEGCPELGMPYLLYAKSLIALAVDENRVLDVPDEVDDEEEDADEDEEEADEAEDNTTSNAADAGGSASTSTAAITNGVEEKSPVSDAADKKELEEEANEASNSRTKTTEDTEEGRSSSSKSTSASKNGTNGDAVGASSSVAAEPVIDDEKPSTSNGNAEVVDGEDEAVSNLRLAWEILELAAKIFERQGLSGLPNLAEVQTELANIEFENNIMDAARDDYEKALKIYKELPKSYHRAMAEIHYKIGLTYLMQQSNKEGAASLKEACDLIDAEISDIKAKDEITEKDKNNIQDMEETKEEIRAKIDEIEEAQAQNIAEVRAALDNYIKPITSINEYGVEKSSSSAGTSKAAGAGSSSSIASSSKPNDISHLIKRKKPEEPTSELEASPAKRPAV